MTEHDAEFFEIFRDEANERLDNIVDTLLALEAGRAQPDAVAALFRDAHTIKGAAGMLGLEDVRALAHAVEDVLDSARETKTFPRELAEPLLRAADALRRQVAGNVESAADLLEELAASRAGLLGREPMADQPAELEAETEDEAPRAPGERRSIRVPAEKIDRLLDLVGETVLHRRRLEHELGERIRRTDQVVADELGIGERLLDELKDAAIGMRTLPLGTIVGPLPRAVRDLALEAGKEVELVVTGADTELDRVILESLSEPLVHLLRNAVGHGIEPAGERERAGKPRKGRVELRAEQRGGQVEIVVADDGRGVSAQVLAAAQREGSLTEVLTRAGFSTAGEVTQLSGRGVGLDAVRAHVESFGGSLEARSEPGKGTEMVLRLPLALALLEVLLVERGGNVYGIPLPSIEEAITVTGTLSLEGKPAVELRGQSVSLVDLSDLVGAEAPAFGAHAPAIVVASGGRRTAAVCDALLGEEEVVVKTLGILHGDVGGYLGAAILGDGRIALLLDPSALTRAPARKRAPRAGDPAAARGKTAQKVLVVEDSFTVRELQRSILEAAGYRVETARDGREGLEKLLRDDEISLVVADIEMPEMDGFELTEAIRADPSRSSLPVIIVTTRADEADRKRGIEAGADAYMTKRSFDQQALLETVERLVGR